MKKKVKKIKLGPFTYKVRYKTKLTEKAVSSSGTKHRTSLMGRTKTSASYIDIKKGLDPVMERDTMLHEAIHAIWYACGGSVMGGFDEESMVSLLTPWILMLVQDNPELVEYLQEK